MLMFRNLGIWGGWGGGVGFGNFRNVEFRNLGLRV